MNLGNKIVSLRKKNNLSQEELAEKVGVTRQTISKWELEETAPDINQAKTLSKIFNVSLDELTNNNINSILTEKISNTERLAGITIKILKVIGVGMLAFIIIIILLFILLNIKSVSNKDRKITGKMAINCKLNNEEYLYEIEHKRYFLLHDLNWESLSVMDRLSCIIKCIILTFVFHSNRRTLLHLSS